jgi:serine protease Do
VAGPMNFPPCPPENPPATTAATVSAMGTASAATGAATVATVSATSPGYIGMRVMAVDSCGVRILEVLPNTPAVTAKLIVKDVIVAVNGEAISGTKQLRDLLSTTQAGDTIKLTIQRAGVEMVVEVTLGTRPAEAPATVPVTVPATAPATAAPTMAATQ